MVRPKWINVRGDVGQVWCETWSDLFREDNAAWWLCSCRPIHYSGQRQWADRMEQHLFLQVFNEQLCAMELRQSQPRFQLEQNFHEVLIEIRLYFLHLHPSASRKLHLVSPAKRNSR